ncbi:GNAT family N-acetyltransferase [Paenibacillus terreus]|uniref:GNAT family N-acetyltransferase n=1 Tax=Paenibacillus terreus TaxID=1387834 RepID=A0ABV5B3J7_9BACL
MKDELPPPNREIMFALSNQHINKGFTTQAAQGLTNYLFEKTNIDVLNAVAKKRNTGSNRVIQKSGFHFVFLRLKNASVLIENKKQSCRNAVTGSTAALLAVTFFRFIS